MSGNVTAVREMSGNLPKVRESLEVVTGKLFVVNFTFGATPVLRTGSIVVSRLHFCDALV